MQLNYPLTFDLTTLTRDYLWGGDRLKPFVPGYPADQPLAEIWVVSDRPEEDKIGRIANGPLTGTTLRELMKSRPNELLGRVQAINGKFPLLIKFLDVAQRFSLQVHPPKVVAEELGADTKPECWILLPGTANGGRFYAGLRKGVSRKMFEDALRSGNDLKPLLHTVVPNEGDCLNIPAGRLHSALEGTFVYEVQTNSNTTYRVSDWGRLDPKTGQPRAIHIEEALQSINFDDIEPTVETPIARIEQGAQVELLVDTPDFVIERWTVDEPVTLSPSKQGSFDVVTVVSGQLEVQGGGETVTLDQFGTALLPAALTEYSLKHATPCVFLRTFVRS